MEYEEHSFGVERLCLKIQVNFPGKWLDRVELEEGTSWDYRRSIEVELYRTGNPGCGLEVIEDVARQLGDRDEVYLDVPRDLRQSRDNIKIEDERSWNGHDSEVPPLY